MKKTIEQYYETIGDFGVYQQALTTTDSPWIEFTYHHN